MTLFLKFTTIGLLFSYIFNMRELSAAAPWEYALEAECSEDRWHLRQRIKEPTADDVLIEFCPEFPCAGLRRDWTFVTDNVNQRLEKEKKRNKKYWCSRARTLNISNNPKNDEIVPIISDGSRPEEEILWKIFPKALPEGFHLDWSYIHKAMKTNGYCPVLYKKDGTQEEHKKYWGYYYGNKAKARLGVEKLNCPHSSKRKKPTVTYDCDKITVHMPFGLKDDNSDSAGEIVTKNKKYVESSSSSDGDYSDEDHIAPSDSSDADYCDEDYRKKRSRKKSSKHKTRKKRANTVIPTSAPFFTPAPIPAPPHHGIPVIPESTELPATQTIIVHEALDHVGLPTAISIPRVSSADALNLLVSQLEEEMRAEGISPSAFVFTPSMYKTPIAQ